MRAADTTPESPRRRGRPPGSGLKVADPAAAAAARADLAVAVRRHDRALEALSAASLARCVAVWHMAEAGMTVRAIAAELGVAHPNVVTMIARAQREGDGGAGTQGDGDGPAAGRRRARPPAAPAPDTTPESPPRGGGGSGCLREGCPMQADAGQRFCRSHQWN